MKISAKTKNRLKTWFKVLSLSVIFILTILGLFSLNTYLKKENLFIYRSGTNEKAFLNATWKMSIREVERANKYYLKNCGDVTSFSDLTGEREKLMDNNRIITKEGAILRMENIEFSVYYKFFDNKLYKILLKAEIKKDKENYADSVIIKYLEPKYGKIKRDSTYYYSGNFNYKNVSIEYFQLIGFSKDYSYLNLDLIYLPIKEEISNVSAKEKENIF